MQHLNKWDWRICSTFAAVNKKQEDMTHKQHKIENLTKKNRAVAIYVEISYGISYISCFYL